MGGFVPAALGQSWDNSCHPHANPWCHGLRPSSHLPPPAPGLEMLTALLFIRAVPAVIGAITEAVQGQAGSSAAVALLCPAGLLPSRWAVGHSVSTALCQAPHSVPQAAPHTQGMDSLCPLRVLARTVDPRASRAVGELAQNTKANHLPGVPAPSQQPQHSPGKPQFLKTMSSSASTAPHVGGCVRAKVSCRER